MLGMRLKMEVKIHGPFYLYNCTEFKGVLHNIPYQYAFIDVPGHLSIQLLSHSYPLIFIKLGFSAYVKIWKSRPKSRSVMVQTYVEVVCFLSYYLSPVVLNANNSMLSVCFGCV